MAKSLFRCSSTFQGDRCKLSRDHVRDVPDQPFHAGNFTAWGDDGVAQGKAPGAVILHKRNRSANRALRSFADSAPTMPTYNPVARAAVKRDLDSLVEFYGGVKCPS